VAIWAETCRKVLINVSEARGTRSLLLGDTESTASTAGGLGALTTDLNAEVMTETSVLAGLLHALKILTETGINLIGNELAPFTITDAALPVKEPKGDAVL